MAIAAGRVLVLLSPTLDAFLRYVRPFPAETLVLYSQPALTYISPLVSDTLQQAPMNGFRSK